MNAIKSSLPVVDEREAAFARLASRVLETLNDAVEYRRNRGATITQIADRIGCHKSSLSRTLNGNCQNITLRTISDILWASDHDPQDFQADPIEDICQNWVSKFDSGTFDNVTQYVTKSILIPENYQYFSNKKIKKEEKFEVVSG